jgi:hypothetical protein
MLSDTSHNRTFHVVLGMCLAVISALTIWNLYTMFWKISVVDDSGLFAQMTSVLLDKNHTLYIDFWDHKPPGIFFFLAPFVLIFGHTALALHLAALTLVYLFAQGLALLVYHYSHRQLLVVVALVLGAYYASLIVYTRGIETTILMEALAFHAIYLIVANRGRTLWLLGSGMLYSFAFITKQPIATDFIILVLLVLYHAPRTVRLRHLLLLGTGCAIGLMFVLVWGLWAGNLAAIWQYAFGANVQYAIGEQQTWLLFDEGDWATAQFYLVRETVPMILPLLIAALLVLFIFIRRKAQSPFPVWIMLLWLVTAILGAMIGRTVKITYFYQVLPVLLLIIILATPLLETRHKLVQSAVVILLTGVVLLSPRGYLADWQPLIETAIRSQSLADTATYLHDHTTPEDCIWLWGYSHIILYYAERYACAAPAHEGMVMLDDGFDITEHRIQYMENLIDNPPAFFVNASAWSLFPMAQQYANRYFREQITELPMTVQRVDTSSWRTAEVHYENLFTMIGVDNFQASEICPQQTLSYSMTWRVHAAPQRYYQMFIQLRDSATNATIAGIDLPPLQNYPTQEWITPREIVLGDIYRLVLPDALTAERYYVATGFYNTDTSERLNILDGAQQVISTETTIDTLTLAEDCE